MYKKYTKKILDRQENSRSKKNSRSTKKFSTDKKILDRQKLILDLPNNSQQVKKIVWPMKKFSRSFQIFLDLPQIFLVRENYFSTDEKVFSIVKNISGSSKINLERQNYFLANKIILHQFCPEWLSILLLYLLLKLPGMTACPTVFPSRFNLLCLA